MASKASAKAGGIRHYMGTPGTIAVTQIRTSELRTVTNTPAVGLSAQVPLLPPGLMIEPHKRESEGKGNEFTLIIQEMKRSLEQQAHEERQSRKGMRGEGGRHQRL